MLRSLLALICSIAIAYSVAADEFFATITKIDGNSVTFKKGAVKGGPKVESAVAAPGIKIVPGEIALKPDKSKDPRQGWTIIEGNQPIKGGLKSDLLIPRS